MRFVLDRRNHIKVESVYRQRFGYYQRNRNKMFSLASQPVMAQQPSTNKKKQFEIRDALVGTGSSEKSWYV